MSRFNIHSKTGAKFRRDTRPFAVRYRDLERIIDLPGWYPAKLGGESLHVGDDMVAVDDALAELKRLSAA